MFFCNGLGSIEFWVCAFGGTDTKNKAEVPTIVTVCRVCIGNRLYNQHLKQRTFL